MRSQVGQAVMTQYGTCGVLSSVESSVQRGVEVFTAGLASQLHHWLLQQRRHGGWSVYTYSTDTEQRYIHHGEQRQ